MTDSLRIPPAFIDPPTIKEMTEQQLHDMIEEIRQRRMIAVTQFAAIQAERDRVREMLYQQKYDRVIKKLASIIGKIDTEMAKLAVEYEKAKVLKLEALGELDG